MSKPGIGYEYLRKDLKKAYEVAEKALLEEKTAFMLPLSGLSGDTILNVILAVLGDHPEICYFDKTQVAIAPLIAESRVKLIHAIKPAESKARMDKLNRVVDEIAWEIDSKCKNDKELITAVYHYLEEHVEYDTEGASRGASLLGGIPEYHNAYGALINHKAVCDGISSAFALICQRLGFRCTVVNGTAFSPMASKQPHSWNMIEWEGNFYHMDATWDISGYKMKKIHFMSYFGLSDDDIALSHDWDISFTPSAKTSKLSLFTTNRLIANSEQDIVTILVKQMQKGPGTIYIKFGPGLIIDKDVNRLIERKLQEAIYKANVNVGNMWFSWNDPLRTGTILLS